MSVSLKEGVKMKQLKKQWNKVTALLLTFGMVFGLFAAVPVQAEDGNGRAVRSQDNSRRRGIVDLDGVGDGARLHRTVDRRGVQAFVFP